MSNPSSGESLLLSSERMNLILDLDVEASCLSWGCCLSEWRSGVA